MSEEKEYPSYNINIGVPTVTKSLLEMQTYKYHPYGLEGFRKNLIEHIEEWQNKGLAWHGHDQLTHAWRTPWDTHFRYQELMSPIVASVMGIIKEISAPNSKWTMRDCWISEYIQNSGANKHDHGTDSLGWSFCYYVKVPDSGPGFTLCDDVCNEIQQINVTEGDLLVFRHPLKHQVFPTLERRIIISGNVYSHDQFTDFLMIEKYYSENYNLEQPILLANHHDVDVDNWDVHVLDQKLGTNIQSGGY